MENPDDSTATLTAPGDRRRVLIVDDHPAIRHGMASLLNAEPDFEVCGEAADGQSGLEAIRRLAPEAVVLDLSLPDIDGVSMVEAIKKFRPFLPILVISMHDQSVVALRALKAGALGYIAKAEAAAEITAGLRKVLAGEVYLSKGFSERLIFRMVHGQKNRRRTPVESLTAREGEILELMGQGLNTRKIAELLKISIKTVETHRGHIKDKFGFDTAEELRRFAEEWVAQKN